MVFGEYSDKIMYNGTSEVCGAFWSNGYPSPTLNFTRMTKSTRKDGNHPEAYGPRPNHIMSWVLEDGCQYAIKKTIRSVVSYPLIGTVCPTLTA